MTYHQLFDKQSADYARFRPVYPDALYAFLARSVPRRRRAWDCGTGNGQAAVALSRFFDEVIATDVSGAQIEKAFADPKVVYRVAPAEKAPLEDASVDLVTVAQAIHWFDLDRFYDEVKRVAAPGALLAVWSYGYFRDSGPVAAIVNRYSRDTLGPYWADRVTLVQEGYRRLPFPFPRREAPAFAFSHEWSPAALKGYLDSWSATQAFRDRHAGADPFDVIRAEVEAAWGDPAKPVRFTWDIPLLVGAIDGRAGSPAP